MSEINYLLYRFLKSVLFVRGRDGIGISFIPIVNDIDNNNNVANKTMKRLDTRYFENSFVMKLGVKKFVSSLVNLIMFNSIRDNYVLIHSRAVPENESNTKSLQPVRYKNTVIVHNGTIYNDKQILTDLYNKYNTREFIDSLAIAKYINDNYDMIFNKKNGKIFNDVKGSYSVIGVYQNRYMFYLVNYQPLYKYQLNTDIIDLDVYTNIEPEVIDNEIRDEIIKCVNEIEPYSFGIIN